MNAETGEPLPSSTVRRTGKAGISAGQVDLLFDVDPPAGYVMEEPEPFHVGGHVSIFTRELVVTIPAWPQADLHVLVTEADGRPAAGAVIDQIWWKGETKPYPECTTDERGVVRLSGIPSIPGEPIRVFANKNGRYANTDEFCLATSKDEVWATIVLPTKQNERWRYRGPSGSVPL